MAQDCRRPRHARRCGSPEFIPFPSTHSCVAAPFDESPALTAVLQAHGSNSTESAIYSHRRACTVGRRWWHAGQAIDCALHRVRKATYGAAGALLQQIMQEPPQQSPVPGLPEAAGAGSHEQTTAGDPAGWPLPPMWVSKKSRGAGVSPSRAVTEADESRGTQPRESPLGGHRSGSAEMRPSLLQLPRGTSSSRRPSGRCLKPDAKPIGPRGGR